MDNKIYTGKSRRMTMGKITVDIENAWIDTSFTKPHYKMLRGRPVNHPNDSINGILIHTSPIVRTEGNLVETRNTVYNVLSWDEQKVHPQMELF